MPPLDTPIRRIKPDDVPLSPDITLAEVDGLIAHSVFDGLDPKFRDSNGFRNTLRTHARIVPCQNGDIIMREGDWGNSAFLVLSGEVAVQLNTPGASLSSGALGRARSKRKTFFQAVAQLWRNHREPEYRDAVKNVWSDQWTAARDTGNRIYFQDVPRLLADFKTVRLQEGELFGELAALGRSARTATVFAVGEPILLELRWQGLRDLMKRDAGLRASIDETFRRNALSTFLRSAPALQHLTEDGEARMELVQGAELETYGEYDRVATVKQLADEGASLDLANEPLIAREGEYGPGVILIRSGVARVSRQHHHGHQTLSYLTPGKMFGLEELRAGWQAGERVPLQNSLRAIGFLTAVIIPTPLAEKHLLKTEALSAQTQPATARFSPPQPATRASDDDLSRVAPDFVEFLVQERFVNGTATMLINLDRCTRCDDCVRACAAAHDNNPRFLRQGPVHGNFMVAKACMHCQDPVCMIECPTGAISRQLVDGEVTINDSTCIGCGACGRNCPYDAIRLVEIRDDQGMFIRATKDRKPITKATKCDLCVDQRGGPACQRACPHDALVRIDMGDVESLAAWLHR